MRIWWVSVSGRVAMLDYLGILEDWEIGGFMRTLKDGRDGGVGGGEEENAERGGDGGGHRESGPDCTDG